MFEPILLSPTSVRDLSCAHKFRELRVLKQWPKERSVSTFLLNGRAAHSVFADLFNPRYGPCPPHRDRLEIALTRAMASERYPDEVSRTVASQWITGLVESYLANYDVQRSVLAVEQSTEFPLCYEGRHVAQVSARLDRIEVDQDDPETLIVVDLAFGRKALSAHQAYMNLAAAKHLYRDQRFRRHRLEIHTVTSEDVQVTVWKGGDLKGVNLEVGALAAAYHKAVEEGNVTATTGQGCVYCELKAGRCPAQVPVDVEDLGFDEEDSDI